MILIKNNNIGLSSMSAFKNVHLDEYFIITKLIDYGIYVGKNATDDIIDYKRLPNDTTVLTTNVGISHKYSLIVYSPTSIIMSQKVKTENNKYLNMKSILSAIIRCLEYIGYENLRVDPYSRGNDILHNDKKVSACVISRNIDEYFYFDAIIQGTIDDKFIDIANSINFPQVKLKNKTIMERIGQLDELENKFDELVNSIRNNWGYDFIVPQEFGRYSIPISWDIDKELVLFKK